MANQLQDSMLKAFDTIAANRVNSLQLDKTVEAIVSQCVNTLTGEYKVEYQGGFMSAYAQEGATYNRNAKVYVLIPSNDMTKKKLILGLVTYIGDDENITFVSSALNDYTPAGKNILSLRDSNDTGVYGVSSYKPYDSITLYNVNDPESILKIDEVELNNNIKDAQALMFEASFLTSLPKEHQVNPKGRYVLELVAAFKNQNELPQDYYTANLPRIPHSSPYLIETQYNVMDTLQAVWDDVVSGLKVKQDETNRLITIVKEYLETHLNLLDNEKNACQRFIDKVTPLTTIEKDPENFNYLYLQEKVKEGQDILAGIIEEAGKEEQIILKHYSYPLDSARMLGDPYRFKKYTEQYELFPIQEGEFSHIENIKLYCENFVEETDEEGLEEFGDTIFCKELEFYCMRKIDGTNGEYILRLSTPQGTTLKSYHTDDAVTVSATVMKQKLDLTDATMFYWFRYDNRIKPSSNKFSKYGGYNWALLDGGVEGTISLNGSQNKAYKNKYKCVAVYQNSVILLQEFYIYNVAAQREISIVSNIGNKFSFDTGVPTFTCLINGKEKDFEKDVTSEGGKHADKQYFFRWSVTDDAGVTTVFDKSIDELKKELNNNSELTPSQMLTYKKLIDQLEGIEFTPNSNKITYAASEINQRATISCSVYLSDEVVEPTIEEAYNIGEASLTIENEANAVEQSDYFVTIDNATQVFQYDEAGIAPDTDRFDDPQEIKPLIAHFFDKSNREIIPERYDIKWRMPIVNSLIEMPSELVQDPTTEKLNLWPTDICNFAIKKHFDYTAYNNQIEAVVTYGGKQYTQSTNFSFLKIGDNGTNGTDTVARLRIKNDIKQINPLLDDYRLAIDITDEDNAVWNIVNSSGNPIKINNTGVFQVDIFQREEQVTGEDIMGTTFGLAGGNKKSRYLTVDGETGALSWRKEGNEPQPSWYRKQILKAETRIKIANNIVDQEDIEDEEIKKARTQVQSYYSFYPIPVIKRNKELDYQIQIKKSGTVENILYDSDGQNPQWNTLQGVELELLGLSTHKYIVYRAEGGYIKSSKNTANQTVYTDPPKNCAFKLKRTNDDDEEATSIIRPSGVTDLITKVYLQPDDIYNGEYTNNVVHIQIYDVKKDLINNNVEAEIWVPIHMSLNTYSLASLNQWDGNHIDINEDEDYIMAPQIGAGIKDFKTNTFTGLVMGQIGTYGRENPKVGLQGYVDGQQSLFVDAYNGNTILGVDQNQDNQPIEGQIKLIPYGDSSIGNWHIGKNDLFNIPEIATALDPKHPDDLSTEGYYLIDNSVANGAYKIKQIDSNKLKTYKGYTQKYSDGTEDHNLGALDSRFKIAIPHELHGILLNADPGRISIKGEQLIPGQTDLGGRTRVKFNPNARNISVDYSDVPIDMNSWLMPGDSYELEFNPNDRSVLTLYQHTEYTEKNGEMIIDEEEGKKWKRIPRAGIDDTGRFYSNALKDSSTALNIGAIKAFNETNTFKGARFEVGVTADSTIPLVKFFTENVGQSNLTTSHLYITGSGDTGGKNEYTREISIHGSELALYAGSSALSPTDDKPKINRTTSNKLVINKDFTFLGHEKNYLEIQNKVSDSSAKSKLYLATNFEFDNIAASKPYSRSLTINTGETSLKTNGKQLEVNTVDNSTSSTPCGSLILTTGTFTHTANGKITIFQKPESDLEIIRGDSATVAKQIYNRLFLGSGTSQLTAKDNFGTLARLTLTVNKESEIDVPYGFNLKGGNSTINIQASNNKASLTLGSTGMSDGSGFYLRGHAANIKSLYLNEGQPAVLVTPRLYVSTSTEYAAHDASHALDINGDAIIRKSLRIKGGNSIEQNLTIEQLGDICIHGAYKYADGIDIGRLESPNDFTYIKDLWVGKWITQHDKWAETLRTDVNTLQGTVSGLEGSVGKIPSHHHDISLSGRAINVVNSTYIPTASLQFFTGPDRPVGAPNGIPPFVKVVGGQIYSNDVIATGGPIAD